MCHQTPAYSVLAQPLITSLIGSYHHHRNHVRGRRIWLACSGGRDSLSLAILCKLLFDQGDLPFLPQLLHVNHGLQVANAAWAEHVQQWAVNNQMTCQVLEVKVEGHNEQAARQARYEAMIAFVNNDDVIILGQHRNDQIETVLMRLFKGSGAKGLSGMQEWTPKQMQISDTIKTIYLWRPWLNISRAQITHYANDSDLDYIDDPTNVMRVDSVEANSNADINVDIKITKHNDRAWLRSQLIPLIKARYPQVDEAIARTSELMQQTSDIIDEQVQHDLACISINNTLAIAIADAQAIIDIGKLLQLSLARQATCIHQWLSPTPLDLPPPKRLVDAVLQLCQRNDNNHQTCHHWYSGQHDYDIRRYKNTLYRLDEDWVDWLTVAPKEQYIELNSSNIAIQPNAIDLKPDHLEFTWTLIGFDKLVSLLVDQYELVNASNMQQKDNCIPNLETNLSRKTSANATSRRFSECNKDKLFYRKSMMLILEPLPRDIKLTLVGRVGSKSGKKLLQALDQPSFMRHSVVLISLCYFRNGSQYTFQNVNVLQGADTIPTLNNDQPSKIPLLILTIDNIHILKSAIEDELKQILQQNQIFIQLSPKV